MELRRNRTGGPCVEPFSITTFIVGVATISLIFNCPDGPRLDKPPSLPTALVAALSEALVPLPHSAANERVRNRLHDRIRTDAAAQCVPCPQPSPFPPVLAAGAAAGFITLANSMTSEGWIELLPKAHAKLLFTDGAAESYMIRLEPGAWAPAHEHPADEECLVLEGSLWQGDIYLKAGDFHVARPGVKHGELRTDTGALVFIRYGRPLGEYLKM